MVFLRTERKRTRTYKRKGARRRYIHKIHFKMFL